MLGAIRGGRVAKVIGTVAECAAAWGLADRLGAARRLGRAWAVCLACRVEISRRARTLAGKAHTAERRIVLNARLLVPGRERDRDATFLHECAHVLADVRYRAHCRHDWRWRRVMALLGEPARVSHDIAYLSPKAHAVVVWACVHCGERFYYVRPPRRRIEDCYCRRCGPRHGRLVALDATGETRPPALRYPVLDNAAASEEWRMSERDEEHGLEAHLARLLAEKRKVESDLNNTGDRKYAARLKSLEQEILEIEARIGDARV